MRDGQGAKNDVGQNVDRGASVEVVHVIDTRAVAVELMNACISSCLVKMHPDL